MTEVLRTGDDLRTFVLRHVWTWRGETDWQIVNTHIDGLLTAALLHHLKGWEVIGFYDTKTLWLASGTPLPLDLDRVAWVDLDMCWPGANSIGQHVISRSRADGDVIEPYRRAVNPSQILGHTDATTDSYQSKYPFGTFQWVWWLARNSPHCPPNPSLGDWVRAGLAWMPDGGRRASAASGSATANGGRSRSWRTGHSPMWRSTTPAVPSTASLEPKRSSALNVASRAGGGRTSSA